MAITAAAALIGSAIVGAGATVVAGKQSSDAAKSAARTAAAGQTQALDATSQAVNLARGEIIPAFESARQSANQGFGRAADFLTGAIPQQIQPFQSGNIAAQQQIARGLPQIQNAILGNQVDLGGFQAQRIPFQSPTLPQQPQQAQAPATPVVGGFDISQLIGLNRTGFPFTGAFNGIGIT